MAESSSKPGIFAKAQKTISRTKTKVLQNLGRAEKTTDDTFTDNVQKIDKQQEVAHHLQKELKQYVHCIKDLCQASKSLQTAIQETYETEWTEEASFKSHLQASELLYTDFLQNVQDSTMVPLHTYLMSFPVLKNKIAKRGRKMVDYDNARHNFETLQAAKKKDELKIQKAQDDLKEAKRIYEDLNNDLHMELPDFYNSRVSFYAELFTSLFGAEHKFHTELGKSNSSLYDISQELGKEYSSFVYMPKRPLSKSLSTNSENGLNGDTSGLSSPSSPGFATSSPAVHSPVSPTSTASTKGDFTQPTYTNDSQSETTTPRYSPRRKAPVAPRRLQRIDEDERILGSGTATAGGTSCSSVTTFQESNSSRASSSKPEAETLEVVKDPSWPVFSSTLRKVGNQLLTLDEASQRKDSYTSSKTAESGRGLIVYSGGKEIGLHKDNLSASGIPQQVESPGTVSREHQHCRDLNEEPDDNDASSLTLGFGDEADRIKQTVSNVSRQLTMSHDQDGNNVSRQLTMSHDRDSSKKTSQSKQSSNSLKRATNIESRPLLCDIESRPLLCDIESRPLLCDIESRPLLCDIESQPSLCDIERRPLLCDIDCSKGEGEGPCGCHIEPLTCVDREYSVSTQPGVSEREQPAATSSSDWRICLSQDSTKLYRTTFIDPPSSSEDDCVDEQETDNQVNFSPGDNHSPFHSSASSKNISQYQETKNFEPQEIQENSNITEVKPENSTRHEVVQFTVPESEENYEGPSLKPSVYPDDKSAAQFAAGETEQKLDLWEFPQFVDIRNNRELRAGKYPSSENVDSIAEDDVIYAEALASDEWTLRSFVRMLMPKTLQLLASHTKSYIDSCLHSDTPLDKDLAEIRRICKDVLTNQTSLCQLTCREHGSSVDVTPDDLDDREVLQPQSDDVITTPLQISDTMVPTGDVTGEENLPSLGEDFTSVDGDFKSIGSENELEISKFGSRSDNLDVCGEVDGTDQERLPSDVGSQHLENAFFLYKGFSPNLRQLQQDEESASPSPQKSFSLPAECSNDSRSKLPESGASPPHLLPDVLSNTDTSCVPLPPPPPSPPPPHFSSVPKESVPIALLSPNEPKFTKPLVSASPASVSETKPRNDEVDSCEAAVEILEKHFHSVLKEIVAKGSSNLKKSHQPIQEGHMTSFTASLHDTILSRLQSSVPMLDRQTVLASDTSRPISKTSVVSASETGSWSSPRESQDALATLSKETDPVWNFGSAHNDVQDSPKLVASDSREGREATHKLVDTQTITGSGSSPPKSLQHFSHRQDAKILPIVPDSVGTKRGLMGKCQTLETKGRNSEKTGPGSPVTQDISLAREDTSLSCDLSLMRQLERSLASRRAAFSQQGSEDNLTLTSAPEDSDHCSHASSEPWLSDWSTQARGSLNSLPGYQIEDTANIDQLLPLKCTSWRDDRILEQEVVSDFNVRNKFSPLLDNDGSQKFCKSSRQRDLVLSPTLTVDVLKVNISTETGAQGDNSCLTACPELDCPPCGSQCYCPGPMVVHISVLMNGESSKLIAGQCETSKVDEKDIVNTTELSKPDIVSTDGIDENELVSLGQFDEEEIVNSSQCMEHKKGNTSGNNEAEPIDIRQSDEMESGNKFENDETETRNIPRYHEKDSTLNFVQTHHTRESRAELSICQETSIPDKHQHTETGSNVTNVLTKINKSQPEIRDMKFDSHCFNEEFMDNFETKTNGFEQGRELNCEGSSICSDTREMDDDQKLMNELKKSETLEDRTVCGGEEDKMKE